MPWKILKKGCSESKPFGVFKKDDEGNAVGSPLGCHATMEQAQKQQAALYVNAEAELVGQAAEQVAKTIKLRALENAAAGKIVEFVAEAESHENIREILRGLLRKRNKNRHLWVADIYGEYVIYEDSDNGGTYRIAYRENGNGYELVGAEEQVVRQVSYVPVGQGF